MELSELESILPEPVDAFGNYVPLKEVKGLVYTSGIIPVKNGEMPIKGKVGGEVTLEEGQECARQCVLNALSLVKRKYGTLAAIKEVVSAKVMVSSVPGFTAQHMVANGASDFLVEAFGDRGRHVRAAFGAASLPLDAPVEVEFVFAV